MQAEFYRRVRDGFATPEGNRRRLGSGSFVHLRLHGLPERESREKDENGGGNDCSAGSSIHG